MSRIDLLTIAVVIVCVLALGLLIYNVVNITGGEDGGTELVEQEDSYDEYFDDNDSNGSSTEEGSVPADEEELDQGIADENTEEDQVELQENSLIADEELDNSDESLPEQYAPKTLGSVGGAYLLIAGSFSSKANAEKHAEKIKNLGYANAVVEPFDRGTINVVLVDRYDQLSTARNEVRTLKNEHGIAAYVKKKAVVKE